MSQFLKPSEIPEAMMSQIRDTFDRNPQIVALRAKADRLKRQGLFAEAVTVLQQIDALYDNAVASVLRDAEQENERASMQALSLPEDKRTRMVELTTTMMMAVDIMETCIAEMDDVVKSVDKDVAFIGCREIRELAKVIRSKLEMFDKDAPFVKNPKWGDEADKMFQMTYNKAKKLLKH